MTYFVSQQSSFLESEAHGSTDSALSAVHSLREKSVREDIARRLSEVCSNFTVDEFEHLVALMAARQVKCERRPAW
jgi:hypothetical protein